MGGYIHAVFSPEDSVVLGGNFMEDAGIRAHFVAAEIESSSGIAPKFCFPNFYELHWYRIAHILTYKSRAFDDETFSELKKWLSLRKKDSPCDLAVLGWLKIAGIRDM